MFIGIVLELRALLERVIDPFKPMPGTYQKSVLEDLFEDTSGNIVGRLAEYVRIARQAIVVQKKIRDAEPVRLDRIRERYHPIG